MSVTTTGSWTVYRYRTVDSTQRVAADLIAAGAVNRTAVVADHQTAGYGRKGDAWHDAPGASLLATLIVRPPARGSLSHMAMIAALAVIDAIADVATTRAVIKWPNDILLNQQKVAGILGDTTWRGTQPDAIRLGIGINVSGDRAMFTHQSLPGATSIAAEAGRGVDRNALLAALLDAVATWQERLDAGAGKEIVARWRRSVSTLGAEVVVTLRDGREIHGRAVDVTDDGDLVVLAEERARVCLAASVTRSVRVCDATPGNVDHAT